MYALSCLSLDVGELMQDSSHGTTTTPKQHFTYLTHGELCGTHTWRCRDCEAHGTLWFDSRLAIQESDDHTADEARKRLGLKASA